MAQRAWRHPFIINGDGVVPNNDADFKEPIFEIATECFGLKTILATVDHELAKRGVSSDGSDPAGEAVVRPYDTTLIVGYMFGVPSAVRPSVVGFRLELIECPVLAETTGPRESGRPN